MPEDEEKVQSAINRLARDLAILRLAEWIAIDHDETRLQAEKYMQDAEELDGYIRIVGYRLVGPKGEIV